MDGAHRRVAQRGGPHARQDQDGRADGGHSVPPVRGPVVRRHRPPPLGQRADLDRRGADHLVDDLLPAEGAARDSRQGAIALRTEEDGSALLRAMPWLFVLIWSTGFIVARFGMPHAPPITFLCIRYALSVLCFGIWIVAARVAWPVGRAQWLHLAVTGVLIHAGYLGGVWAAVKAGLGAGTVALLVGLQPVLTALWLTLTTGAGRHRIPTQQWVGLLLGLAGLMLVVWRKLGVGEVTAWNLALAIVALLSITTGALYQKRHVAPCDVRSANLVQLLAALAVSLPLALL